MRWLRILSRYVLHEVILYAALGFFALATLLVGVNLLNRLDDLVAIGIRGREVFSVLGLLFTMLVTYTIPVAFLFGILLGLGRMAADSEVLALRACGVGLRRLLAPLLVLALLLSGITAWGLMELEPAARRELRGLVRELASRGGVLEPGEFKDLGSRVVFVGDRDRDNQLQQVMIWDESDRARPFYVFAEEGVYSFDPERAEVHLRLHNGDIHFAPSDPSDERYRRIVFEDFDYAFDVSEVFADWSSQLRPQEMGLEALREALDRVRAGDTRGLYRKEPISYEIQLHRRLALPGAPVVFALVGVPLALRRARGARSSGALLGGLLFFGYYALLRFGERVGADGVLPPLLAMWLPNLVFAALALALLRRTTRPN